MRLPAVTRDALTPDEQAIWDRIDAVRPGFRGPYGVLIHVPVLAERVAALEDYFRFDAALPAADRELVVLAVVREAGARYAWVRHEAAGRQAGTRPEAIEILRANDTLEGLTPHEALLVEIARTLLHTRTLPEALYRRGVEELGERQLVEVVTLVGHYCLIGFIANGFDVQPPEGSPPSF
jgi:4-carboxymuconolactone decarboxylase